VKEEIGKVLLAIIIVLSSLLTFRTFVHKIIFFIYRKYNMRCNRLCLILPMLAILKDRLTRAFQPIRTAVNTTQYPLSARSSNSIWTKLSTIAAATTSKMGIDATAAATELATESSSCNDTKNTVTTFTSSCLFPDKGEQEQTPTRTALIILNYPIPSNSLLLNHLWKTSSTRIAADGGANRLYEYSKELIPDRIRGDLDSLDPSVRAYYESRSVSVEQDFCQDTNDLDKALQILVSDKDSSNTVADRVVIYGAFGGRFDQEMASFAALYKWAPDFNGQLYLYSDETCAFLIPANKDCEIRLPFYGSTHNVKEQELEIGEGPTCGLIPLGCRCESIVTSGLKWDLDGTTPLEFGGLVSSSNRIMEPTVKVFASHPLVFTAELISKNSI
jgi:thiamine pyrophosphokinase